MKGTIDLPLKDFKKGKRINAKTDYEVIERIGQFSYVRINPEAGRKHQIRRHMSDSGFSIVGDTKYRKATKGI